MDRPRPLAIALDGRREIEVANSCQSLCKKPPPGEEARQDAAPYDHCKTEEEVSFRQHLEGDDNDTTEMTCVAVGCHMHGAGHVFIGAEMYESSGSPDDPMFFLHHAQYDDLPAPK